MTGRKKSKYTTNFRRLSMKQRSLALVKCKKQKALNQRINEDLFSTPRPISSPQKPCIYQNICDERDSNLHQFQNTDLPLVPDVVQNSTQLRHISIAFDALKVLNTSVESVESASGLFEVIDTRPKEKDNDVLNTSVQSSSGSFQVYDTPTCEENDYIDNNTHASEPGCSYWCRDVYSPNDKQLSPNEEEFPRFSHSTPIKKTQETQTNSPYSTEQNVFPDLEEFMDSRSIEDHSLVVEVGGSPPRPPKLFGRRIVDISHMIKQFQDEKHGGGLDCTFLEMDFVKEKVNGFSSSWTFKCRLCNKVTKFTSEDPAKCDTYMNVNDAAVHSIIATGGGYSQLNEFSAGMDIHCMSHAVFTKHFQKVAKAIEDAALTSMLEGAKEEILIALAEGNIDKDGIPMCVVIADGAWCKRSYKTSYDSLSGVASIVGFKSGKVLFISVRNRYCSICALQKNKNLPPSEHMCFLNWNKSATSMEADIITEGFRRSVELLGLKFNKLIGDGDSSVHRRLLETKPYGPDLLVEKVECRNHVLRNYSHKLADLCKKTQFPVTARALLKDQVLRFRMAVTKAIKYRGAEKTPLHTKVINLKHDIENGPYHMFGQHDKCAPYFCNGPKDGEENHVPTLHACGFLQEIVEILRKSVVRHVSSLIADQNNNLSEQYNSFVNKFVGGKRINYALRGQYRTRCSAAVVSFNDISNYLKIVHKTMMNSSPGLNTKKFIEQQKKGHSLKTKRRLDFPQDKRKKHKTSCGPDEHYGLLLQEFSEECTPEEIELRKATFLQNISRTKEEREQLQELTVLQSASHLWRTERKKLLTASNFGKVCKMRPTTSCRVLVHSMLYGSFHGKATDHGIVNEPVAREKMALDHDIVATECGLFVDDVFHFLGASPDGLVRDNAIMEIKCPYSAKDSESPEDAVTSNKIKYCDLVDGKLLLKPDSDYYYQVQGQLHITSRQYCYFVIYTPKWLSYEIIQYDCDFWQIKMVDSLCRFYTECILPELINPQFARRLQKSDIIDPPYIVDAQQKSKAEKQKPKTMIKRKRKQH